MAILNFLNKPVSEGVSVVTAIKNRKSHLLESLPTWLNNPSVNEVVIVDWSSDEAVIGAINHIENKHKIVLIRAEDEPNWILSHAYNLGIKCASKTKILKLDSDIKLNKDFFVNCNLDSKSFFTGRWELARNKNEAHLNGSAFANRSDLLQLKGYDERITSYGWDDTDLYSRLEKLGLFRKSIKPDFLNHIPHDDLMRTKHQKLDEGYKNNLRELIIKHSEITASRSPWGSQVNHIQVEFIVTRESNNYFTCKRKPAKLYIDLKGSLTNRLRDYLISLKIADDLNREVSVIWEIDDKCNFSFSDFFKNDITIINRFNLDSFKPKTKFYFLDNENFSNQCIEASSSDDIVIRAKKGFSYEHENILPLNKITSSLKQHIKVNFKKLIPREPSAMLLKNILDNILSGNIDDTDTKANSITSKQKKVVTVKKIHNYKNATEVVRDSLRKYIQVSNVKSLVIGIQEDVNSAVCAALCKPVCNEFNIPLIGVSVIIQGSQSQLIKDICSLFCHEFNEVNLTDPYNSYMKLVQSDSNNTIKNEMIDMYLQNHASSKYGVVVSSISQLDTMLGLFNFNNPNKINLLDGFFKTEIFRLCKYLANKDVKKVKEKQLMHKLEKSIEPDYLKSIGAKSHDEAETIIKEFVNGNSHYNNHILIQSYKKHNAIQSSIVNRANLVNSD